MDNYKYKVILVDEYDDLIDVIYCETLKEAREYISHEYYHSIEKLE